MNKDKIKSVAQAEGFSVDIYDGVLDIEPDLYDFAERLLKDYHFECLMKLNKELDKFAFMGKEWQIISDCQSALSELVPHNLNGNYIESRY